MVVEFDEGLGCACSGRGDIRGVQWQIKVPKG